MRQIDNHDRLVVGRRNQGGDEHVHQGLVFAIDTQLRLPRSLVVPLDQSIQDRDGVLLRVLVPPQSGDGPPVERIADGMFPEIHLWKTLKGRQAGLEVVLDLYRDVLVSWDADGGLSR